VRLDYVNLIESIGNTVLTCKNIQRNILQRCHKCRSGHTRECKAAADAKKGKDSLNSVVWWKLKGETMLKERLKNTNVSHKVKDFENMNFSEFNWVVTRSFLNDREVKRCFVVSKVDKEEYTAKKRKIEEENNANSKKKQKLQVMDQEQQQTEPKQQENEQQETTNEFNDTEAQVPNRTHIATVSAKQQEQLTPDILQVVHDLYNRSELKAYVPLLMQLTTDELGQKILLSWKW